MSIQEKNYPKKIVIITTTQLSLNPRLVKEADALTEAGFEVSVLYAYWNKWGAEHDKDLLSKKRWKAILLGGDPIQKPIMYFSSRLIRKLAESLLNKTGKYKYFANISIIRSSYFSIKASKKYEADLYIAHTLGALPAAVKTSKKYGKPCGFDAEDFHRQEINDDVNSYHFKIRKYIEDKYLPSVNYITAASPLIAEKYTQLYDRNVTSILNVFPKTHVHVVNNNAQGALKLFWFSQTIGSNRGLERIIEAITLAKIPIELHLLGQIADVYKQQLIQNAQMGKTDNFKLYFYEPIKAVEIFNVAQQFDIGLASEPGFCLNNNLALSNKIFTYIQAGLAIAASATPAQLALINQHPKTGKVYNSATELSNILKEYNNNRELLFQTKNQSFEIGQSQLNWENESHKLLKVIKDVLAISPNGEA